MQVDPISHDPLAAPTELTPVPIYKEWVDPCEKSEAFALLDAMFKERICFIDGAMGTRIQTFKLEGEEYHGDCYDVGHVSYTTPNLAMTSTRKYAIFKEQDMPSVSLMAPWRQIQTCTIHELSECIVIVEFCYH